MAYLLYLVASLSCGVLAALYWRQENMLAAAIAGIACIFFVARLFLRRRPAAVDASPASTGQATDEAAQARRELEEMLPPLRRNRTLMRTLFLVLLLAGIGVALNNLPLGLAILAFALVPGILLWRTMQALQLIEDGLARHTP